VITGSPGTALMVGDKMQPAASSVYTDNSIHDVTTTLTWAVTPSADATLNTAGLLTANALGTLVDTPLKTSC
jgi:hypothetical protein